MNKILVVGDLHLREKEPYFSQGKDFLDYLFNNTLNNSSTTLVMLGDLVESISATAELLEIYVDYFVNHSTFKSIKIITGNHDRTLDTNLLSIFRPIPKVEVIDIWKLDCIDGINVLYLPHIEQNMVETYSNLPITESIDYCFAHVEDDTEHFSNKYCDLSKYNIQHFLNGHIHTESISKKGHYLGSPTFNSISEKDKIPYIALIDCSTKKYELIEVPKLISYYDVFYPKPLEVPITKYGIFTIYDSIDKEESIQYYTKQALELGFNFYSRRVHNKKIKNDLIQMDKEYVDKSLIEHFEVYCQGNAVSNDISDICKKVLKTVE